MCLNCGYTTHTHTHTPFDLASSGAQNCRRMLLPPSFPIPGFSAAYSSDPVWTELTGITLQKASGGWSKSDSVLCIVPGDRTEAGKPQYGG